MTKLSPPPQTGGAAFPYLAGNFHEAYGKDSLNLEDFIPYASHFQRRHQEQECVNLMTQHCSW